MRIVIVGGGFAGVWAALSAAAKRGAGSRAFDVTLVSRDPWLTIRPRLYEDSLEDARVPLDDVLRPAGVERVEAEVQRIDASARQVLLADGRVLAYDRLVLATGSVGHRAAIPGAATAFAVDTYADAAALQEHLDSLGVRGDQAPGQYTAVVVGAGFTGIEVATQLASRMRRIAALAGAAELARVVLVERSPVLVPDLGDDARRHVIRALDELRVEWRSATAVDQIDPGGVTLAGGEWIPASTIVLTGGFRANALAADLGGDHDALGRVSVDDYLRVRGVDGVYAAGDVACAVADESGHIVPMSCQCAVPMGEAAGANAAADLLGTTGAPFRYPWYVTCLDLGEAGALFMQGWDREVKLTGIWAKLLKQTINTRLIYPPRAGHASRPASDQRTAA